jgi:ribosome-associated protein
MNNDNPESIAITPKLTIPTAELTFQFSRSGGPGGQNVNRRETRAELLFDVANSPSLDEKQRSRLLRRLDNHIDRHGVLHVVSQAHRSQRRNREEALERFAHLLRSALRKRKRRIGTKVPKKAKERRLAEKRRRSEAKKRRKTVRSDPEA